MARLWFFNANARRPILEKLEQVRQVGYFRSELRSLGAIPNRYFGEIIFLVREGSDRPFIWAKVPSAQSGYHPSESKIRGLLTNQTESLRIAPFRTFIRLMLASELRTSQHTQ